jgi:hypothetical protein
LGKDPLLLTTSDTIQLVIDTLVAQRRFHQPKATAKAVRQANRLAIHSTLSIANIGHSSLDETPVCEALMKRLASLISSGPNKTSSVDRQVQHISNYVVNSTSVRSTQKATLQDVATLVSTAPMLQAVIFSRTSHITFTQKFVSQRAVVFRLLQSIYDNRVRILLEPS